MFENGVWRTVGGRRIFIKDGEDLETAMKKSGKFKNKEYKSNIESKDNELNDKNNDSNNSKYQKEIDNLKKELEEKGFKFEDGFPQKCNKEFIAIQLNELKNIVDNDKTMGKYLKDNPLTIKEELYSLADASYAHLPSEGFNEHSLRFGVFKLRNDSEKINANIDKYRSDGQWINKEMSNVANDKYILYHELGHIKEKIMVENYLKENPKFKEKYIKKMNNAKTQEDYNAYAHNMYKDALYHLEQDYLIPIQEKNGTINASGGRNGKSAYSDYGKFGGLKEIGTYGSTSDSFELISEGNVILTYPTNKGKNSYIYKDLSKLMERWYK